MINLKQDIGAHAATKSKLSGKEVATDASTNKRTKRNAPPRPAQIDEARRTGLTVPRVFSRADAKPFEQLEWERRTAEITDDTGKVIFRQEGVEVPKSWSVLATKVVVSKYFYGENGTPEREQSARQLIHRVARTIADWGKADGYFASDKDAEVYYDELAWLCINQYGSFNSPVWFNCGLYHEYGAGKGNNAGNFHFDPETRTVQRAASQYEYPQCSACFIQAVGDRMEDIMELARSEAMLFKYGSGTGTDLSSLRSMREKLSGGGRPSGPMSFLKVYDSIASVVKSGGKTRRAAKMNTLKVWHPDIKEFIDAKPNEEKKAWALIADGYAGDFNGEAYGSVLFQNENLSVRVTDEFMRAVIEDKDWATHWVTDPSKPGPKYKARELMLGIAEGTWTCGDPGVQYEDTIQRWHTCKNTAPINSSNPCSEYMFLDDSACNLASLNLMKFLREDGTFDIERYKTAVEIFITAQEILVDHASYPTERIALNSHLFRPLGLGYANLGSLIMALGLAYDSDEGRAMAGALTAILHLHAYTQSARIAERTGPFEGFARNREPMLQVAEMHRDAVKRIHPSCPDYLRGAAQRCGDEAVELGRRYGYRNSQVTVLAPTGTIAFMMDCDTTGIEPDIALVKYKLLAGGGMLKIVNRTAPMALRRLGYSENQIADIVRYIDENDTIEGAPHLQDKHLSVFDCAFKPAKGKRSIPHMAHLKMMAACQPFLSGAISKTVNMPQESTVDDITRTYIEGWKLGLKAVAIYRDGSKRSQPLSTSKSTSSKRLEVAEKEAESFKVRVLQLESEIKELRFRAEAPVRHRLPDTRQAITHKFDVAGHEGYITVGLYEDGSPGELFITMAKEGSTIGGLMDTIGTLVSLAFQYGVPVETLVNKFAHQRFEPSGFTKNPDIPIAKSIIDYLFRWLGCQFIPGYRAANSPNAGQSELPLKEVSDQEKAVVNKPVRDLEQTGEVPSRPPGHHAPQTPVQQLNRSVEHFMQDAPACDTCGAITVRNGACYKCLNCGNSMGCS
ncbi:MAG TPA: vitamin B12-dependent ribonucleotide reductase [Verrucomicrobiae bacterium]|nr:vitamin B12-dependent ribonucleotide reductase [Verrucomicrobiae bacterium]